MPAYTERDVPDESGRCFFITGANTGIGFETARVLAARGAKVLLGCRSSTAGALAIEKIVALHKSAEVELIKLDLANLASVKDAAQRVREEPRLDVLINNAGVMAPPRTLTKDGFESQFGINHLGHFALTRHLLGKLAQNPGARVVTVASSAHRFGSINFADLHAQHRYQPMAQYAMSKLANLLTTCELQRRLDADKVDIKALACHPGGADTNLARHFPTQWYNIIAPLARMVINSAAEGALPTLRAATDHTAKSGDYFGPAGMFELAGSARLVAMSSAAKNASLASRLWGFSSTLVGVEAELSLSQAKP